MTLPSWQNPKLGSKVRAGLWLETEVGEGNIFTKTALRQAFPDVAQIDRRLRELRPHGWRIDTSRDEPALKQEEQRYVTKGAEVWIPGQAKVARHKGSLSDAQRGKIMQGDSFICRTCGIGAGEAYEEGGHELSKLNIARREVQLTDGAMEVHLVTECKRCGAAGANAVDLADVLGTVKALSSLERRALAGWIDADRRVQGALERIWGTYRTLPLASREAVRQATADVNE